jgi:hypothetical protein
MVEFYETQQGNHVNENDFDATIFNPVASTNVQTSEMDPEFAPVNARPWNSICWYTLERMNNF